MKILVAELGWCGAFVGVGVIGAVVAVLLGNYLVAIPLGLGLALIGCRVAGCLFRAVALE